MRTPPAGLFPLPVFFIPQRQRSPGTLLGRNPHSAWPRTRTGPLEKPAPAAAALEIRGEAGLGECDARVDEHRDAMAAEAAHPMLRRVGDAVRGVVVARP